MIDTPACSRCGKQKTDNELNGYDPLATAGQKYANAYCIKVAQCQSSEAERILDSVVRVLKK